MFPEHITSWLADDLMDVLGYRLNTFPLIHLNFIHALLNAIALTPLMERFESEYGTLTTLALFFGRMDNNLHSTCVPLI